MVENLISFLILAAVILSLQIRKVEDAVKLLSFQSVLLGILAGVISWKTGAHHLLIAAIMTLVFKAIAIPYILYYTIIKIGITREVERFISKSVSLLIALSLTLLGFYVTGKLELPSVIVGSEYLSISIILIFLGSFIMISHKKAIMQGIGLITIENGLFLIAISLTSGMPLLVELGIFFDLLIAAIIIGIFSFQIHSTFDSLNTEKLNKLKG